VLNYIAQEKDHVYCIGNTSMGIEWIGKVFRQSKEIVPANCMHIQLAVLYVHEGEGKLSHYC
jgi:hypothetical protein